MNKNYLKKFGLSLGSVFLILGLVSLYKNYLLPVLGFYLVGLLIIGLAIFSPTRLKLVYWLWIGCSAVISNIIFKIILVFFYYLIITPIGFLGRILGKNFLLLKINKNKNTYWSIKDKLAKSKFFYERPY